MKTFVQVAEVWVPSADGRQLELSAGLFDGAPAFGEISRAMRFARGEGLPGRAWDEGRPLLLRRLEGSYFRRAAAAQAAGLCCAVALPIFVDDKLTCVVLMLCGDAQAAVGAVELWHNDPRITVDLKLADGYFSATDPELEALTRDGSLSRGSGAPGMAWQRESAVFIDSVGDSHKFLRAQVAARAGIVRALAIPCTALGRGTWILSLLSSSGAPIARRFESWLSDAAGTHLQRAFGFCEVRGRLAVDIASAQAPSALGPIGEAWRSGVAQAATGNQALSALGEGEAAAAGLSSLLAIPVISDDAVTEVVALYF